MDDAIVRHCAQIDRCNQRGGRMLSIVDLIEAGTMSVDLAAYAMAAIGQGASFLTGALAGGAGKTTVMGALLNFVPAEVELAVADGLAAIERGMQSGAPRRCYICHEIGPSGHYAYLWAGALRGYFGLAKRGHMLATNLHADTYEQARAQICDDNGVTEAQLRQVHLMFFLSVKHTDAGVVRKVREVWESDGRSPHRRVYALGEAAAPIGGGRWVSEEALIRSRATIDRLMMAETGAGTIQQVRAAVVGGG